MSYLSKFDFAIKFAVYIPLDFVKESIETAYSDDVLKDRPNFWWNIFDGNLSL